METIEVIGLISSVLGILSFFGISIPITSVLKKLYNVSFLETLFPKLHFKKVTVVLS